MTLRVREDFAGGSAALISPWIQAALASQTVNRNGSGVAVASALSGNDVNAYRNETFGNDQYSAATVGGTLSASNQYVAVHVRASSTGGTYKSYSFYTDGTTGVTHTGLYKANGTTGNDLVGFATTFTAGDRMLLRVVGATLYAYKNGVLLGTYTDDGTTFGAIYPSGAPGLGLTVITSTAPTLDNFEGGDVPVFLRSAAFSGSGATPIANSITTNLGETVLVGVTFNPTTCAVTGVTDNAGGGSATYSKIGEFVQSTSVKHELWSTTASGGKAGTTTVSVAFSGTNTDSGALVAVYGGVGGLGLYTTGGAASGSPSLALTPGEAWNPVAAFYAMLSAVTPTAATGDLIKTDGDVSIEQALVENAVASGSVTASLTSPSATPWAGGVLELRTTAVANSAALTGTVTASITEADIVTGGNTIIITLTGDTWILP